MTLRVTVTVEVTVQTHTSVIARIALTVTLTVSVTLTVQTHTSVIAWTRLTLKSVDCPTAANCAATCRPGHVISNLARTAAS